MARLVAKFSVTLYAEHHADTCANKSISLPLTASFLPSTSLSLSHTLTWQGTSEGTQLARLLFQCYEALEKGHLELPQDYGNLDGETERAHNLLLGLRAVASGGRSGADSVGSET